MNKSTASYRMAAIPLFVSVITACQVGPNYEKPTLSLPGRFLNMPAISNRPSPQLDHWWTEFNDPVLTRIVERAIAENLDLSAAFARIDQARATAQMADANLLPTVGADLGIASERQSLKSPIGEIASQAPNYKRNNVLHDVGVGASWEVDLFGGLRRGREADLAALQVAQAEGVGVRISVAAESADAYFRVRGAQERILLAQHQITADSKLLALINFRLQEGLATKLEQAEAESRLAQMRASVPKLQTELSLQLNRLDVLMGSSPGTDVIGINHTAFDQQKNQITTPAIALTMTPKEILEHRPDIIAAERKVAAANARIGVAVADYYPKVSLSSLLGFEGLNTSALSSATFQPNAILGVHWRLFDFGRVESEVAQAKGARLEAMIHYRQTMLRATEEIENNLITRAQLEEERHERLQEVNADTTARNSAQSAYEGGVLSLVEVLEQDRQLYAAQDQFAQVNMNINRSAVSTYRALGGSW